MNDLTISKLQPLLPVASDPEPRPTREAVTPFADFVQRSLETVNGQMVAANRAIEDLATGNNTDIHHTMIAMEKASVSFELVMQIRNKLMAAYDEIRRMSI